MLTRRFRDSYPAMPHMFYMTQNNRQPQFECAGCTHSRPLYATTELAGGRLSLQKQPRTERHSWQEAVSSNWGLENTPILSASHAREARLQQLGTAMWLLLTNHCIPAVGSLPLAHLYTSANLELTNQMLNPSDPNFHRDARQTKWRLRWRRGKHLRRQTRYIAENPPRRLKLAVKKTVMKTFLARASLADNVTASTVTVYCASMPFPCPRSRELWRNRLCKQVV